MEVLRVKSFEKQYVVDNIAQKYGHTVLRLPPYYCIFNPIELIWGQLKKRIRRKNCYPKFDQKVVELINQEASQITPEDWRKKVAKVIKCEDEYRRLGQVLINGDKEFIINLSENTDEEDEEGL